MQPSVFLRGATTVAAKLIREEVLLNCRLQCVKTWSSYGNNCPYGIRCPYRKHCLHRINSPTGSTLLTGSTPPEVNFFHHDTT